MKQRQFQAHGDPPCLFGEQGGDCRFEHFIGGPLEQLQPAGEHRALQPPYRLVHSDWIAGVAPRRQDDRGPELPHGAKVFGPLVRGDGSIEDVRQHRVAAHLGVEAFDQQAYGFSVTADRGDTMFSVIVMPYAGAVARAGPAAVRWPPS